MSLLDFFKNKSEDNKKILALIDNIEEIKSKLHSLENNLARVEIIALESRKKYAKKLANVTSEEEKDSSVCSNPMLIPER